MSTQTDLEKHEAVCEERYIRINERLDHLDGQIDDIRKSLDTFKGDVYKLLIGCATSIVVCLVSATITLLSHFK